MVETPRFPDIRHMKVVILSALCIGQDILSYHDSPLIRLIISELFICMCIFLLLVRVFWLLYIFYLVGWEVGVYVTLMRARLC